MALNPFLAQQLPFGPQTPYTYTGQLPPGYLSFDNARPTTSGQLALPRGAAAPRALPPVGGTSGGSGIPMGPAGGAAGRAPFPFDPRNPTGQARLSRLPTPPPAPPPAPPQGVRGIRGGNPLRPSQLRSALYTPPGSGAQSIPAAQGAGGAGGAQARAGARVGAGPISTGTPAPTSGAFHGPFQGPPPAQTFSQRASAGLKSRGFQSPKMFKGNMLRAAGPAAGGLAATSLGSEWYGSDVAGADTVGAGLLAGGQGVGYGALPMALGAGTIATAPGVGVGVAAAAARPYTRNVDRQSRAAEHDRIGGLIPTTGEDARDIVTNPLGFVSSVGAEGLRGIGVEGPAEALRRGERGMEDMPILGDLLFGGGDDQAAAQEQEAQAQAQQQQEALTRADPETMFDLLTRAGVSEESAAIALDEYEQALGMYQVQAELGQLAVYENPETGEPVIGPLVDENGEPVPGAENATIPSEEALRVYAADQIYAAIPSIVEADYARMEELNRAAAFQAILAQSSQPLLASSAQTQQAFQNAGDPIGALYAQNILNSNMGAMAAMPFQQAIDEQLQWDQRVAQIQQEQALNRLMYGDQQEQGSGSDEVDALLNP